MNNNKKCLDQTWFLQRWEQRKSVEHDYMDPRWDEFEHPKPSAVLIPLIEREHGLSVLLTQRAAHLPNHAGQVAFPGGKVDPGDENTFATALRESDEEVGLHPRHVKVLGEITTYITVTGFVITPVVGLVSNEATFTPAPGEVADIFEVPLEFLFDRENHVRQMDVYGGVERHYFAIPYENRRIWGATAAIIINLCNSVHQS